MKNKHSIYTGARLAAGILAFLHLGGYMWFGTSGIVNSIAVFSIVMSGFVVAFLPRRLLSCPVTTTIFVLVCLIGIAGTAYLIQGDLTKSWGAEWDVAGMRLVAITAFLVAIAESASARRSN